jgi:hypothetical protein
MKIAATGLLFRLLSVTLVSGVGLAAGAPLASHRALYDITLARAEPRSAIVQASGRLVIEWLDTCDGFTTNQRMYTQLGRAEGGLVLSDLVVSSWESRDGNTFRFALTNRTNGKIDESSRGTAKAGKEGAQGAVEFEQPRAETLDLPPGTLFPTAHLRALIEAARESRHHVSKVVFDGSADSGLNEVSAFIGKRGEAAAGAGVQGARELASGAYWPVRMAFFDHPGTDDYPSYEFAYHMYENGVADALEFDYGSFVIKGALAQIDALPDAGCKSPKRR